MFFCLPKHQEILKLFVHLEGAYVKSMNLAVVTHDMMISDSAFMTIPTESIDDCR
jgi:hypothetical protein